MNQFGLDLISELAMCFLDFLDQRGILGLDPLDLAPRDLECFHCFGNFHAVSNDIFADQLPDLRLYNSVGLPLLVSESVTLASPILIDFFSGLLSVFLLMCRSGEVPKFFS